MKSERGGEKTYNSDLAHFNHFSIYIRNIRWIQIWMPQSLCRRWLISILPERRKLLIATICYLEQCSYILPR